MAEQPPPLSYWPIQTPQGPIYDSSAHRCEFCEALEAVVPPDTSFSGPLSSSGGWRWAYIIPYTRQRINDAAAAGCMFFVWAQPRFGPQGGRPVSEYHPELKDDLDKEPNCDSWFVFRFVILEEQLTRPSREDLVPAKISYLEVSFRSEDERWDQLLYPVSRPSRNKIKEFYPKVPGVETCLAGPISCLKILLQIRDRLVDCFQYHRHCHRDVTNDKSRVRPLRFLSLDTSSTSEHVRLCTLDLDSRRPYVTLSYVWGQEQITKTTFATLARHEHGIAIDALPGTIRDAIFISRLLGVDLLWVDSLCIVQDDPDEVAVEIANMGSYYRNALLTLSVAAAKSCAEGFLGRKETSQNADWFQFDLPFVAPPMSRLRLPLWRPTTQYYPLDGRAWALQETLLSRRLVTIGYQTTSWSCRTATYGRVHFRHEREDLGKLMDATTKAPQVNLTNLSSGRNWADHDPAIHLSSARQLLTSPYRIETSPNPERSGELFRWHTVEPALLFWFRLVFQYARRVLSEPLDILSGISGIAQELSFHFSDNPSGLDAPKYLAGLWWSQYFPIELLWRPAEKTAPSTVYTAPTWSWASVKTPFRMATIALNIDSRCFQQIKIISCHIERRSPKAPYGAVTGGHLIIQGRTFRINSESVTLVKTYRIQLHGDTEYINIEELATGKKVFTLLEILSEMTIDDQGLGPGLGVRGLILEESKDGSFRRVGVFGHESATGEDQPRGEDLERELRWRDRLFMMPWETMTLKIL